MTTNKPAVQGGPVAWVTADTVEGHTLNGKPRRIWWENNEGVGMPIYTAPQPAEQQSAPDVAVLVEALETISEIDYDTPIDDTDTVRLWAACDGIRRAKLIAVKALAAYRQGGGE